MPQSWITREPETSSSSAAENMSSPARASTLPPETEAEVSGTPLFTSQSSMEPSSRTTPLISKLLSRVYTQEPPVTVRSASPPVPRHEQVSSAMPPFCTVKLSQTSSPLTQNMVPSTVICAPSGMMRLPAT